MPPSREAKTHSTRRKRDTTPLIEYVQCIRYWLQKCRLQTAAGWKSFTAAIARICYAANDEE